MSSENPVPTPEQMAEMLSKGIFRFNIPMELGLALSHSKRSRKQPRVYLFDKKPYQAQRSTSNVNGIDPQIHGGEPKALMAGCATSFVSLVM